MFGPEAAFSADLRIKKASPSASHYLDFGVSGILFPIRRQVSGTRFPKHQLIRLCHTRTIVLAPQIPKHRKNIFNRGFWVLVSGCWVLEGRGGRQAVGGALWTRMSDECWVTEGSGGPFGVSGILFPIRRQVSGTRFPETPK